MGYPYYFQFTLTPYGKEIERNLREKKEIVITFQSLSKAIGKERVIWRYDPIILNDMLTEAYHEEMFTDLCRELCDFTDSCIISFVDVYQKLNRTVKEDLLKDISEEQMHRLASVFSGIAGDYRIELQACCEKVDFRYDGVRPSSCIDKLRIEKICGHLVTAGNDKSQRPGCGCVQSVDIGAYNTCRNGCIYCYANHSDASIQRNCMRHNPNSDILIDTVKEMPSH
jgi:hypothetical protein